MSACGPDAIWGAYTLLYTITHVKHKSYVLGDAAIPQLLASLECIRDHKSSCKYDRILGYLNDEICSGIFSDWNSIYSENIHPSICLIPAAADDPQLCEILLEHSENCFFWGLLYRMAFWVYPYPRHASWHMCMSLAKPRCISFWSREMCSSCTAQRGMNGHMVSRNRFIAMCAWVGPDAWWIWGRPHRQGTCTPTYLLSWIHNASTITAADPPSGSVILVSSIWNKVVTYMLPSIIQCGSPTTCSIEPLYLLC